MPGNPNKLSRFWQELKRRKVIHVITVYAGAAFVIIELINNVTEPLRLPEWTPTLVIIILLIGFPLAVIFSWIYDIHPEKGVVETEQASDVKADQTSKSSSSWKIASYISFVVIVGLIVLNIIPRTGREKVSDVPDKSIAVLPFESLSKDEELQYQADGVMDAILLHLSKIEDLRVMSRTSVEQYRDTKKTVPEICQEMGVAYVLEGSFQKSGDRIRLIVQLIQSGIEGHVWANNYDREWKDIFAVQSEVAQAVAGELQAVITPEVKERIEKIPTSSTTAFDLFQKANKVGEEESIDLLYYALDYDSTFVLPYVSLGMKYLGKYIYNPDLYNSYLDSVTRMTERALHFDSQSAEAYSLQGYLFSEEGNEKDALLSFDRALQLNPNLAEAYNGKGWIYFREMDVVNALDNFYQNILRNRTPDNLGKNYESIGFMLTNVGLREQAIQSYNKMLHYMGDSIWYFMHRAQLEFYTGNYSGAIEIAQKEYEEKLVNGIDLQMIHYYGLAILGESCMYAGRYLESYRYFRRYIDFADSIGWPLPYHKMNIAFIFRENGLNERASELIDQQIKQSEDWIAENHIYNNSEHYQHLAEAYYLKQDKENALRYLKLFGQQERMNAVQTLFPENPIFRGMTGDPEFIQICDQIQAKYITEQERVRQWLEENDLL